MADHTRNKTEKDRNTDQREPVTLVKGSHRWTFTCDPGDEPALLRRLAELADGKDVPFDWFDAALVSHQLSNRLRPGLKRVQAGRAASRGTGTNS